jgi:hypothetical protein
LPFIKDEFLTSRPVVSVSRLAPIMIVATKDNQLKKYL